MYASKVLFCNIRRGNKNTHTHTHNIQTTVKKKKNNNNDIYAVGLFTQNIRVIEIQHSEQLPEYVFVHKNEINKIKINK